MIIAERDEIAILEGGQSRTERCVSDDRGRCIRKSVIDSKPRPGSGGTRVCNCSMRPTVCCRAALPRELSMGRAPPRHCCICYFAVRVGGRIDPGRPDDLCRAPAAPLLHRSLGAHRRTGVFLRSPGGRKCPRFGKLSNSWTGLGSMSSGSWRRSITSSVDLGLLAAVNFGAH